jgi:hypothetical protein
MRILGYIFIKKKNCLVPFSRLYHRLLMFIKIKESGRFEVLAVAAMKSTVICDLMPSCMAYSLTLKVEAVHSCEKTCRITWHHIPEDSNLQHDMKEVGGYMK